MTMKKVKGYTRKDGTHVPGYCRRKPLRRAGAGRVGTGDVRVPLSRVKTLI